MADHSEHMAVGGGMDMMMETMTMYFYWEGKVKFLFESYDVTTTGGYFSVILVAFILGFACEVLSILQDKLDQRITVQVKDGLDKLRSKRCGQGLLFTLRIFVSYLCMLAVMTYNVGVLIAVVTGLSLAYMIVGFQPAEVIVLGNALELKQPINLQ